MSDTNLHKELAKFKRERDMRISEELQGQFDRENGEKSYFRAIRDKKRFKVKHKGRAFEEDDY